MSSIGFKYGFFPQTLWDHPDNAALKAARKDPYVLLPGDVVAIPDQRQKTVTVASGSTHQFRRKGVPARLKLRLVKDGQPRANQPYVLDLGDRQLSGSTDGDGRIEQMIPPDALRAKLLLRDGAEVYALELGRLQPVSTLTGVQARLKNLGFYFGPLDGAAGPALDDAVKRFQRSADRPESGTLDDATRQALADAYGD